MTENKLKPWQVISSREVFVAEPWIKIDSQHIRLPDGGIVYDYHQIRLQDFVAVFAETPDGRIVVERQYKHGVGMVTLVLPAGAIEKGESPIDAAKRELLEETGYSSDDWQPLGSFAISGNYGCGRAHAFRANKVRYTAEPDSGDLEEMEIVLMKPGELLESIRQGDVHLLATIAVVALATNPLLHPAATEPNLS